MVAENLPNSNPDSSSFINASTTQFNQHREWSVGMTWKSSLNNLRLIIQPYIFYHLLLPWLDVFNIPGMRRCLLKLIELMNGFRASPIPFSIAS
ncbi:hypothetical protein [uncultured Nostoc sp.]|uniref:hypothetical protein n=1 Tax=uncultured Nostoc sp. TaxID=340711 RepID=UPI00263797E9|nr:hypothetical protein [uncultured Nostoc sp.]